MIELLIVILVIGVLAAAAIPQATAGLDASRARAAARYMAARMALARSQAVMRSANVAIRFVEKAAGFEMQMFADGNRNGVRTKEIASGVDRPLSAASRLHETFPGVSIGLSPEPGLDGGAVRFGDAGLVSFTALGTATPGTVYLVGRDGSRYAVRVTGATARTRVLRYRNGTWTDR